VDSRKYQIVVTQRYLDDVADVMDYTFMISKDQQVAVKIASEIDSAVESLEEMPNRGANYSLLIGRDTDLKYLMVYKYAIIYRVEGDIVRVLAVVHTSRNLIKTFY